MNRRSIIVLLIGAIAALAGFGSATALRTRRCRRLGGQWDPASRSCATDTGAVLDATSLLDAAAGVLITILVVFMLFRALMFVTGRAPRRSP